MTPNTMTPGAHVRIKPCIRTGLESLFGGPLPETLVCTEVRGIRCCVRVTSAPENRPGIWVTTSMLEVTA